MGNIKNSVDKFYLVEDRRNTPKESFKFQFEMAKPFLLTKNKPLIADIGCATGDFLYYIHTQLPNAKLVGYDIQIDLIEVARKLNPNIDFRIANITQPGDFDNQKFDCVFMSGVSGYFDDLSWLKNMLSLILPDGRIFIMGLFNPEPIDVIIKTKPSLTDENFASHWNCFSMETISKFLSLYGFNCQFNEFKLNIDLARNKENPYRSYTINIENGERLIINGAQFIQRFYLLQIFKKEKI